MEKLKSDFYKLEKNKHNKGTNWNIATSLLKGIIYSQALTFTQQVVVAKLIKMLQRQKNLDESNMKEFVQILDVHRMNMFKGIGLEDIGKNVSEK